MKKQLFISLLAVTAIAGGTALAVKTINANAKLTAADDVRTMTFDVNSIESSGYAREYSVASHKAYVNLYNNNKYDTTETEHLFVKQASDNNFYVNSSSTYSSGFECPFGRIVSFSVNYTITAPATVAEGNWWIKFAVHPYSYSDSFSAKISNPVSNQVYTVEEAAEYNSSYVYRVIHFQMYGDMAGYLDSITVNYLCA